MGFRKGDKVKANAYSGEATFIRVIDENLDPIIFDYYRHEGKSDELIDRCVIVWDSGERGGATVDGVERAGYYISTSSLSLVRSPSPFDLLKEKWERKQYVSKTR